MSSKYNENSRAPDVEKARLSHVDSSLSTNEIVKQSNLVFLTAGEKRLHSLIDRLMMVELIDDRFYLGYLHVIDQSTIILSDAQYLRESPVKQSDDQPMYIRDVARVGSILIKLEHVRKCSLWTNQDSINTSMGSLTKVGKPIVPQIEDVMLTPTQVQYRDPPLYMTE